MCVDTCVFTRVRKNALRVIMCVRICEYTCFYRYIFFKWHLYVHQVAYVCAHTYLYIFVFGSAFVSVIECVCVRVGVFKFDYVCTYV